EDFDDAAARHAANAEREIDADGAGRNGFDRLNGALLSEAHDRAFAELLLDLADGQFDGFLFLAVLTVVHSFNDRHVGELLLWKRAYSRVGPGESQGQICKRSG